MRQWPASPEAFYESYAQAAINVTKNARAFAALMEDPESKMLLDGAQARIGEPSDASSSWKVSGYYGWLDGAQPTVSSQDLSDRADKSAQDHKISLPGIEEIGAIVERFKNENTTVTVNWNTVLNTIEVANRSLYKRL